MISELSSLSSDKSKITKKRLRSTEATMGAHPGRQSTESVHLRASANRDTRVPRRINDTALMRWHGSVGCAWPWARAESAESP
jgi:hypothetical protein